MDLKEFIEKLEKLDDNQFEIGLGLTRPQFEALLTKFKKLEDSTRILVDDREKLYAILICKNWISDPKSVGRLILNSEINLKQNGENFIRIVMPRLKQSLKSSNLALAVIPEDREKNPTSLDKILKYIHAENKSEAERLEKERLAEEARRVEVERLEKETYTNSLLQSLQVKLAERDQQNSAPSLSQKPYTPTDIKTLDALVCDLQENQKEKKALEESSQTLEAQSKHLQETLQKEITAQKSEYARLEQQQAELQKRNTDLEKSLTQTFSAEQQRIQADLKASQESYALSLEQQQAAFQKKITELEASLTKASDSEQQRIQADLKASQESYALSLEQQQAAFQKQNTDLEKSLTQTFSAEQQRMQTKLEELQVQQSAAKAQLDILWNEHEIKARKQEALKRFQSHPNLLLFYRTVHIKLEEIFISFKAVAGGFVNPVDGPVATLKSIFDTLGDTASIVPLLGPAVQKVLKWTISKMLGKIDGARQKNTAINASELVTLSEVKKYAESIARQLTERYADQLERLLMTPEEEQAETHKLKQGLNKVKERVLKDSPVPPAKQLAIFGVLWIVNELYDAENIDVSKELDEALLSVISQKTLPDKLTKCWQKITTGLGIQGVNSKSREIWHPESVYTLPGLRVGNEYYSNETLEPSIYGWRLGTVQEVQDLGLRQVPAPTATSFILETQTVVQSISAVNSTIKKVEQKTDEHNAQLKALQADLEQTKKKLEQLELNDRAENPSPRRPSGIKDFKKKDEKENILDALRELRKFFIGQRDSGAQSLNLETYEKYLRLASDKCVKIDNKYVELIYKQKDEKHVLCIDGNELNATAAAEAILQMIKDVESQSFQATSSAHNPPAMLPQYQSTTTATSQKTPDRQTNSKNHCSIS